MSALVSSRLDVELDAAGFMAEMEARGWGDGLPCIPPTEELVQRYVDASGRAATDVVAILPPVFAPCTVEKIAVNAALTGAPIESMPLLCAVVTALGNPDLQLAGMNATTASVTPAVIVNGAVRDRLRIPYQHSCFGGAPGSAASIGRALRLLMRHVAGQVPGTTSEVVFGQPSRVVGLVTGEWEERSPWAPLAERRGVPGDAVTVYGAMGNLNVVDTVAEGPDHLLHVIGRSAASMGANGFLAGTAFSEVLIALNPTWAAVIGERYPDMADVQRRIWEHAALAIDEFPSGNRPGIEELGRVDADSRVHLVADPEAVLVFTAGGPGSLHAQVLHGFSAALAVTVAI